MSSSRRHLVSRSRNNVESSPAQRRARETVEPHQSTALPPYELPSCPLSATARRALDDLRDNHDYTKYKKHLDASVKNITVSVADSNERLYNRKQKVQKLAEKRQNQGDDAPEKTEQEVGLETFTDGMEKNVGNLTVKAEKALRDLIDYKDELAMQDTIMKDVSQNIAATPAHRPPARRRRRAESDGDEEDGDDNEQELKDEASLADEDILSAVELLKKAKEDYAAAYFSKPMRERYDHNDYRGFKRTLHDALNGPDAAPLPPVRAWFPKEARDARNDSSRSQTANNDEDSDNDVVIASATINLKCPITLQMFQEPYSNKACKHTFEKQAIIQYIQDNGTVSNHPSHRRGQRLRRGPKLAKCPQVGCDVMFELDDFYDDQLLLRQVKRATKQARRELEDDEEEPTALRGTQRTRPEEVDDEGDSVEFDEDRKQTIAGITRQRAQSQGLSMALSRLAGSSPEPDDDEIEEMEVE